MNDKKKENGPADPLCPSGRWGLFQIVRGTSAAEFPPANQRPFEVNTTQAHFPPTSR